MAEDISFQHMGEIQRKLIQVIADDPDTQAYASNWGTPFPATR